MRNSFPVKLWDHWIKADFFFPFPSCGIASRKPHHLCFIGEWIGINVLGNAEWRRPKRQNKTQLFNYLGGGKLEERGKEKMVGMDGDLWGSRDEWEDEGKEATMHKRQCNNSIDYDTVLTLEVFCSYSLHTRIFPHEQAQVSRHTS